MTTQNLELTNVYQVVVVGAALITLVRGTRMRYHIGTVLPAANTLNFPIIIFCWITAILSFQDVCF